jgi:hypothetical protein
MVELTLGILGNQGTLSTLKTLTFQQDLFSQIVLHLLLHSNN